MYCTSLNSAYYNVSKSYTSILRNFKKLQRYYLKIANRLSRIIVNTNKRQNAQGAHSICLPNQ